MMTRFPILPAFFLSISLLLTSCANYPMQPLQEGLIPAPEMNGWVRDDKWWNGYADSELDRLVQTALDNNVNLARSAIAVNRALYQANLIGADLLPTFSGNAATGPSTALKTGTTSHTYQGNLGLSYELDLWQRLANSSSAARWEYEATAQDREAARLALINSVVDAYFQLRYQEEAMAVTRSSMERYTRLLDIVRAKYDLGRGTAVEPLQAEQFLLQARNNLLSFQASRNTTEQLLRDLLNARPGLAFTAFTSTGLPLLQTPTVPVDLAVPIAALSARPDIHSAEARLQAAFKDLQATENIWYPGVSIGSTLSLSTNSASRFFELPVLGNLIQVTFPFLDFNRLRWNIRISESDFETSRLTFVETVTTALNEVAAARYAFENARLSLANTLAKYEKDMRICDYYATRYELGAAELKDYLDALNTADSSMLSALESKYQSIRFENQVYKAMGTNWIKQ